MTVVSRRQYCRIDRILDYYSKKKKLSNVNFDLTDTLFLMQ